MHPDMFPEQPPEPQANSPDPPEKRVQRLTAANALTLLRLLFAPACAWFTLEGRDVEAVIVFGVAIATDLADGPLARKRGQSSAFGALLDHGTDATFVIMGVSALVCLGLAPIALPPLIALAFAQYTLDSRALEGQQLRASALGRWNGIFYFVLLGTPIIRNVLGWTWPQDESILLLGWLLVISTVVSMADRLLALRRVRVGRGG
jgi:phosphatidylglycerophosphate synthase